MRIKLEDASFVNTGAYIIMTLRIPKVYASIVESFRQMFKPAEYEIKLLRKKRSLDANALCWVVCTEISNVIGKTKEDVYRDAINHVGVYDQLQFNDTPTKSRFDAMAAFKQKWASNGEGWRTKTLDADKCIIQAYYGSSRYDTKEMSVLIDYLIGEARSMGIDFMTESEIDLIKREWK